MKLVTTIVSNEDVDKLVSTLVNRGHPVTRIGSTGGFLRRGNATLLLGVEDDEVDDVIETIRQICPARSKMVPPPPSLTPASGLALTPIEVRQGGAVIFVQHVERFEKT